MDLADSFYSSTPVISEVISDRSEQVWEFKYDASTCSHEIIIPDANYNGKTLKIRAKGLVFGCTYIEPALFDDGNPRWAGTNIRIYNTDYTEFSWPITYDGNVNILRLDLYAKSFSLYIADVIIGVVVGDM